MNQLATKRLRIHCQITFLFVLMFLESCSSVTGISTSTSQSPTKAAIPNTIEPAVTFTSLPTAVPPTAIVLQIPENIIKFQPFQIKSEAPQAAKSAGALAMCSDSAISVLLFNPDVKVETIVENAGDPLCLPTSPDGKWIAYQQNSKESPTGSWLIIQSADGQQKKKVPTDQYWISFYDYAWLDNQHLIFNDFKNPEQRNPAYAVVVINPFTEEHIELASDYPELHLGISGSALAFDYSDVAYDPSLNLVIFPAWNGYDYIVLWDRRAKTVLAKVKSPGFRRYPLWSPDATHFVVPAMNTKGNHGIYEWYSIGREGQIEQLTHFGDYFSSSQISSANWSPNGHKLAFWVDLTPSPCSNLRLAILDVDTKQVTNTCLPSKLYNDSPPLWSLDSRFILIQDANATPIRTILVDTENGQAFDIASLISDSNPFGWLHYNE